MRPMPPGGDWKSRAADNLQRIGRGESAKALYGVRDRKGQPSGELRASQLREEGERRTARARPKSRLARLLAWFHL